MMMIAARRAATTSANAGTRHLHRRSWCSGRNVRPDSPPSSWPAFAVSQPVTISSSEATPTVRHFSSSGGSGSGMDAPSSGKAGVRACPVRGGERKLSTAPSADVAADVDAGSEARHHPELRKVPSMPVFGSFFSAVPIVGEYLATANGIPIITAGNAYDYYPEMRRRFGDFYAVDIPGQGTGPRGTCIFLTDPNEMIKVLRHEGGRPRGGVEGLWPFINWARSRGMTMAGSGHGGDLGFFGRGNTWRRLRTFLQTDLLSPQAARGYVTGVAEAATTASRAAPQHAAKPRGLNDFFNYAAFDMFNTIFFGNRSNVSDPNVPTDPEDAEFCSAAVNSLALLIEHLFDHKQGMLVKMGIETELNRKFVKDMDTVERIARAKIERFLARHDAGELDDVERASYLARAIGRLRAEDAAVTPEEFKEICVLLLNASVDTTSTFIAWLVVHLAVNPDVQERLAEEVGANVDANGGVLGAEILTKKRSPYLHAAMRESHRMTPVHPTTMSKSNSAGPITVHGIEFPKDSVFTFEQLSVGMDPDIVDDPERFRPERWLPTGLEAMKGTPAEVLDHPFYRDPFSQGARRCPGSRVAVNETLAILARLVYDWRIEVPAELGVQTYRDIPYTMQTLLVPQLPELKLTPRR